jgi:hypothetical protein
VASAAVHCCGRIAPANDEAMPFFRSVVYPTAKNAFALARFQNEHRFSCSHSAMGGKKVSDPNCQESVLRGLRTIGGRHLFSARSLNGCLICGADGVHLFELHFFRSFVIFIVCDRVSGRLGAVSD